MHILCATDLSAEARNAADVAAALAAKLKLRLRLAHCTDRFIAVGEGMAVPVDDTRAREQLAAEAERVRASGVDVTAHLCHGDPPAEVAALAKDPATVLLVLGPVLPGLIARFIAGSVARQTAEKAIVPTLIVRDAPPLLTWLRQQKPLKILCGVNFKPSTDGAIAYLKQLADLGPMDLSAAYISALPEAVEQGQEQTRVQADLCEHLHAVLGTVPALKATSLKVEVHATLDVPSQEFIRTAGRQGAELIVIGTRRRPGLDRLLEPSFTHGVVLHAKTNVLCIPALARSAELAPPPIHRVLAATDLSETGDRAIRHAYSLLPMGGELRLLHVCQLPVGLNEIAGIPACSAEPLLPTAEVRQEIEIKLQKITPRGLAAAVIDTSFEVVSAHDAATAICQAAERFGADVICMGTTGTSRLRVALLGSTAQSVIAHSHRPVLVVPPPRE